jgi:hypothetical protein
LVKAVVFCQKGGAMSESRVEFNSRLKDLFPDYDGADNEPLTWEENFGVSDDDLTDKVQRPLDSPEVLYLVRYFWFLHRAESRRLLLDLAKFLYQMERD